jgi:FlaA1/EpsC-like NDP-sugar epimerase
MWNTIRRSQIIGKASALDGVVLCLAYYLAFLIRFEGAPPAEEWDAFWGALPGLVAVEMLFLAALKVPRLTWRYIGLIEARRIAVALALASGLLIAWRLASASLGGGPAAAPWAKVPVGVLIIDFEVGLLGLLLVRVSARLWHEHCEWTTRAPKVIRVPTLLIGAGSAGAMVAKEIFACPSAGINPVGFVDDDPAKAGTIIHGLRVLGSTAEIERIIHATGARQAVVTIGVLPREKLRRLFQDCKEAGIPTKIIPGIREMMDGSVNLSAIREVSVQDVLRRDSVRLDTHAIARVIQGRRLLVTGAGGSIGSELCRVAARYQPDVLILVEKCELNLFQVHRQLAERFPQLQVVPCIADICDRRRMKQIFAAWRPDVVLHAAAHKHVPLMEWNPGEAIKNNVLGTRLLADVANASGVSQFVMISTDKAVNPSSIMGVSKRMAELYVRALAERSQTAFVTVRFGNVLGSSGSVIPIFMEQIARGGPVTVTHPEMTRYFMTIPEACQLVLQAAAMGQGGELFVLDMGQPVKIVDLARDLIRLAGPSASDVEIHFSGVRPGEKLFEELASTEERVKKTQHPHIFIGRSRVEPWAEINRQIDELGELADSADVARLVAKIKEVVPEYEQQARPFAEPLPAPEPAPAEPAAAPAAVAAPSDPDLAVPGTAAPSDPDLVVAGGAPAWGSLG